MTATYYVLARFTDDRTAHVIERSLLPQAREQASLWAVVLAYGKSHAKRLLLEGVEAIQGVDGRIERCGIVRGGVRRHV